MVDTITTTSEAANNPTPPNPSPAERWADRSAPAVAQPSRPGAITSEAFHRLGPDVQAGYVNLPGGQWIERSKLETQPARAADPARAATADTSAMAAAVTADGKLKVGDYELSSDDIAMLMQTKAAADLKAAGLPADASGYQPTLPEGLELPEGLDFKPDLADPAFKDFQALGKKLGLSQTEFSELYGVYVAKTVASEAAFRNSMKTELDALGANATMRVTALETWLRGTVGDDIAKHMRAGMFSAKIVQGLELIAKKMGNQGAASFRQDGREPSTGGKGPLSSMSDAEYNALSASEKYSIAKQG
jgi:hypothetical protein